MTYSTNSHNLIEIDQEQSLDLLKFFINAQQNVFLFGRRGTGKTQIAMQAIKELNLNINYINLSVIERPDLAGYPNIYNDSETVTFKSPHFLPSLTDGSKANSVILFDEIDKAPPEVTAPLLEILQFKTINGKKLNVAACILTGNLLSEGAYSNIISSAVLDRGAKYILTFNFNTWLEWARKNNIHDLITGFLRSNPQYACGDLEASQMASPSPRGWEMASKALVAATKHKIVDSTSIEHIVAGFVGAGASLSFKIWYDCFRKYEQYLATILHTGESALKFKLLDATEKLVLTLSLCYLAKQMILEDRTNFTPLENLHKYITKNNIDPEILVMCLCNSFDFNMITELELYKSKKFFNLFVKVNENLTIK